MDEKEKVYTLKSVQSELKKLEKSRDKKKAKIAELTSEMKADSKRIKELEGIYDKLYHEDLQRQIATAWFKEQKMTGSQIQKFLQLSSKIHEQIDVLDVNVIVQAIMQLGDKQQLVQSTSPVAEESSATSSGATYSTVSNMTGGNSNDGEA